MAEEDDFDGGELVFSGNSNWSLIGRKEKTSKFDGVETLELPNFHRLKTLLNVKVTQVFTGCVSAHIICTASSGQVYSWGRNEYGQLGQNHFTNVYMPTELNLPLDDSQNESVVNASCGGNHSILITSLGRAFSAGSNQSGQLGLGKVSDGAKVFTEIKTKDTDISFAWSSCGREFTILVDNSGKVYSFGHPEYGQLGNGTEGKFLEKAGKISFQFVTSPTSVAVADKISSCASGANHTLLLSDEGKVYSFGFGGYGRLGLGHNKDQFTPLALPYFSDEPKEPNPNLPKFMQRYIPATRATFIACGASCSYAILKDNKNLTMWGICKKAGEAVMAPQLCGEVSGWRVGNFAIAAGQSSSIVASERSVITWGPSPTYGELGYGVNGPKSSTKSKKVDDLEGCKCPRVAMGSCYSLCIIDETNNVKIKKILEKLPVLDVEKLGIEPTEGSGPEANKPKGPKIEKKRKAKAKNGKSADTEEGEDDESEPAKKSKNN